MTTVEAIGTAKRNTKIPPVSNHLTLGPGERQDVASISHAYR